jgi:hypothetical protein
MCAHPGDTRNFENYPEPTAEELQGAGVNLDAFQKLFKVIFNAAHLN